MVDKSSAKGHKRAAPASAKHPESQGNKADKRSKATERDERRRDRALTKICARSDQRGFRSSTSQPEPCQIAQVPSRAPSTAGSVDQLSVDIHMSNADQTELWGPVPERQVATYHQTDKPRVAPQATFSPTAARLRPDPEAAPVALTDIQSVIADAIKQGIAAGIQQIHHADYLPLGPASEQGFNLDPMIQYESADLHETYASDHSHNQDQVSDYEGHQELELSEDEGMQPEQPSFTDLFPPGLFKSLLYKAINSANLGQQSNEPPKEQPGPSDPLFNQATAHADIVPSPQLFMDVVQKQWSTLASGPTPLATDKKHYM